MRLVLAYDGSENARKAVNFAVKVFKAGDEFHLVTVVREAPRSPEQIVIDSESKAEDLLQEIEGELRGFRVVKKILESNDVAQAIIDYCRDVECDLIVSGSRGLTGMRRLVLGSVSKSLLDRSPFPVLVVK